MRQILQSVIEIYYEVRQVLQRTLGINYKA